VQDQHRVLVRRAQRGVVQAQLGQDFARVKPKVANDPAAFLGRRKLRRRIGGKRRQRQQSVREIIFGSVMSVFRQ